MGYLFVLLIMSFIIAPVTVYFKNKRLSQQSSEEFIFNHFEKKSSVIKPNPDSTHTDLNDIKYFRAIKYSQLYFTTIETGIGLILMPIHFYIGLGIAILFFFLSFYHHKQYLKTLVYTGINVEQNRIVISRVNNEKLIINYEQVRKITFKNLYQANQRGVETKVGCEMIFWDDKDEIIDSFDYQKFKKSKLIRELILERVGS